MILADEPTGNLDTQTSIEIMGVFQKLNDEGITIVMVTHELDIASYTKRNIVMRDGKIVGDTQVKPRLFSDRGIAQIARSAGSGTIGAMKLFIILRVAARALRRNQLRTILTMLGMIIGVGAVIVTQSLGNGAKAQVEAQIASLGQNVILIFSGSFTRGGVRSGGYTAGTLTLEDCACHRAGNSRRHARQS